MDVKRSYNNPRKKKKGGNFHTQNDFHVGQTVEVLDENGVWRKGVVSGVFKNFESYLVVFGNNNVSVNVQVCVSRLRPLSSSSSSSDHHHHDHDHNDAMQEEVPIDFYRSQSRVHPEFDDDSWISSLDQVQTESFPIEVSSGSRSDPAQRGNLHASTALGRRISIAQDSCGKGLKLKIKYGQHDLQAKFSPGMTVEVRSDEDGYEGAWYTAAIVGSAGAGKFVVEYKTLKTDDETEFLKEVAKEEDIRPCPPEISRSHRYKVFQEVDAWHNEGWWEGVISEVLDDWKYVVYFASSKEKSIYQHSYLRPHQNWVLGKWNLPSLKARTELLIAATESLQENFAKGSVVEVRRDEEVFKGSWYSGNVIGFTAKDKLLVEYISLKTNDDKRLLREEVFIHDVRPSPPWILHAARYQCTEKVDVWNDGGWWEGMILEVLENKKYIVYFPSTGGKEECHHVNVRPHQDWIDRKWIVAKERPSDSTLRAISSKMKCSGSKANADFRKGAMVEVRSDVVGYGDSWYSAVILQKKRSGKFLVEYCMLKTDEGKKFRREEANAQNVRPCPPEEMKTHYQLLEKVDAWYNNGWWAGLISEVLGDGKYMVFFETTREDMEFDHINLRPHQEWVNGKWIVATKGN